MNYYEILQLKVECSQNDIRKAYRKIAIIHHPDKNQNDPKATEKFQKITEAYSVLSDLKKRQQYDKYLSSHNRSYYKDPIKNKSYNRPNYDQWSEYHINVSLTDLLVFKWRNLKLNNYPFIVKIPLYGVSNGSNKVFALNSAGKILEYKFYFYLVEEKGFKTDGFNILFKQKISFWKILFGGKVNVPLLDGEIQVVIPKGNYVLKLLKVKQKGLYLNETIRGDLILEVSASRLGRQVFSFLKLVRII